MAVSDDVMLRKDRFEERQIRLFKVLEREPRFSCEAKACSANISDKHICDKN